MWTRFRNDGSVDVSGRHSACTSTEESSRLRASMSLRVKISVCTRTTILQGGSELGLNGVDNLYIPTSSLVICFSILEDSGASADTYFDTARSNVLALSLLLSSVDIHTERLPLASTHPLLTTWYL